MRAVKYKTARPHDSHCADCGAKFAASQKGKVRCEQCLFTDEGESK